MRKEATCEINMGRFDNDDAQMSPEVFKVDLFAEPELL